MSKDKKPYLCSVCGTTWESASKRVPRHRCKGEFEGKVGTGIPAEGHPDYEAPVIEEKPIAGDIVFSVPEGMEEDDSEPMPIAIPKEEKKKPSKPKVEKKPESLPTIGEESKSLTPALMQTLNAIISGGPLSKEQASVLSAQLVDGAVDIETSPVKAEITGLPLLIGIGVLTVGLFWKAMSSQRKPKQPEQVRFDPNTEQW